MCPGDAPSGHISGSPSGWETGLLDSAPLSLYEGLNAAFIDIKRTTKSAQQLEDMLQRRGEETRQPVDHLFILRPEGQEIWNWYLAHPVGPPVPKRVRVLLVGRDGAQPALLVNFLTVFPSVSRDEKAAYSNDRLISSTSNETRELFEHIFARFPHGVAGIIITDSLEKDTNSADGSLGAADAIPPAEGPVYVTIMCSKYKEPKTANAPSECAHAPVPDRLCLTPVFSTPMHPDPSDVGRRLAELLENPVGNASGVSKPEYEVFPEPKDPSERVELCPSGLKVEEID